MPFTPLNIPARNNAPAPQQGPEKKTMGGFFNNIGKSGLETVKGIGSAAINVLNPNMEKNTVANLARLGIGTAQLLDPTQILGTGQEQTARNVGSFYNNRYGLSDIFKGDFKSAGNKIGDTLYNDPVGALLDASVVLDAGGSLLGKVGDVSKINELATAGKFAKNAGRAIDPIGIASRGTSKLFSKTVGRAIDPALEAVSRETMVKSVRPSPGQLTKFREATGMDFGDFLRQEKLYGGARQAYGKVSAAADESQGAYNALARSGKVVDAAPYIKKLRDEAARITANDFSVEAQKVSKAIGEQADLIESSAKASGGKVPIDILTNTKSSSFGKVPGNVMVDPTSFNANKIAGGVGAGAIEQMAPGSADLGKRLQALREAQDILKKQSELSRGSQVINNVKPVMAGFTAGAAAGSFLPGVGNVVGGAIGAGGAIAANHPKVLSGISKGIDAVRGGSFATPKIFSKAMSLGKMGRTLVPSAQPQQSDYTDPVQNPTPAVQPTSGFQPLPNQPVTALPASSKKVKMPTMKALPMPKSNYNLGTANFNKVKKLTRSSSY